MSAAFKRKGLAACCAFTFMLAASSAYSQEATRQPTIADCPAGYTLGVQDTTEAMLAAKPPVPSGDTSPTTDSTHDSNTDAAAEAAKEAAAAPRKFVTGCIPPQPKQSR